MNCIKLSVLKSSYRISLLFTMALFVISLHGCKDKDDDSPVPAPTTTDITFEIENSAGGEVIEMDTLRYTNDAGNVYSVSLLKYYLSNFIFTDTTGAEFKAPNYELIDESDASFKTFVINDVPNGIYSNMQFMMGVDSTRNFAGALTGDLDPVYGMLWDWNTGYVYFMHEGNFIDSTGAVNSVHFHYGTLKALVTESLPVSIELNGTPKKIKMRFDLNKVYNSPNQMNFNGDNFHQSTGPGENGWVQLLKQNFAGAFTVVSVE